MAAAENPLPLVLPVTHSEDTRRDRWCSGGPAEAIGQTARLGGGVTLGRYDGCPTVGQNSPFGEFYRPDLRLFLDRAIRPKFNRCNQRLSVISLFYRSIDGIGTGTRDRFSS